MAEFEREALRFDAAILKVEQGDWERSAIGETGTNEQIGQAHLKKLLNSAIGPPKRSQQSGATDFCVYFGISGLNSLETANSRHAEPGTEANFTVWLDLGFSFRARTTRPLPSGP